MPGLRSIINRIRSVFQRSGAKPKAPRLPASMLPPGNRGIAMGSRTDPDLGRYQERIERAHEEIPPTEVEQFLAGDIIMFVNSSNVAAVQYHPEDEKLMVEFLGGGAYLYSNVTAQEALSFATAQSKGSWVWDYLRIRGSRTGHKKPYVKLGSTSLPDPARMTRAELEAREAQTREQIREDLRRVFGR